MKKNKLSKKQGEALLKIKEYFQKRILNDQERVPHYCESALDIIKKVYVEGEYDNSTKLVLNKYRDNYHADLKEFGKDFKGMDLPFGPKVTVI